jgi:hypothetical protein
MSDSDASRELSARIDDRIETERGVTQSDF